MEMYSYNEVILMHRPAHELASIINDVFFDMGIDPGEKQVSKIKKIIESRDDADECAVALDICNTYLSEGT